MKITLHQSIYIDYISHCKDKLMEGRGTELIELGKWIQDGGTMQN